jgi:hypothetical protein
MKALLALIFFLTASRAAAHGGNLRANQFDDPKRFSPWLAMLPHL